MAEAVTTKTRDLRDRLARNGIIEGADGLISEKQVLAGFPHWSKHQLRRWRENQTLLAAPSPGREPRYSLESIARGFVEGDLHEIF